MMLWTNLSPTSLATASFLGFSILASVAHGQAVQKSNQTTAPRDAEQTDRVRQYIAFGPIEEQRVGSTLSLPDKAGSGLPIKYASFTPGVCLVAGSVVVSLSSQIRRNSNEA